MDRNSPQYQERKALWELSQSKGWVEVLKPILERQAENQSPKAIHSLDDAFVVANDHAVMAYAQYLLALVERKSSEFVNYKG